MYEHDKNIIALSPDTAPCPVCSRRKKLRYLFYKKKL